MVIKGVSWMGICGERLKELREKKGLYPSEIAKILGISRTAYIKYESGETAHPRKIDELAAFFNVSVDYLLGRLDSPHGTPFAGQDGKHFLLFAGQAKNEIPPPTDNIKIPIIGSVKCGYDGLAYEYLDGYVMIDNTKHHGDIKAFRCRGDSMNGLGIFEGDIAIVRVQDDVDNGDLAIVIVDGDEGMLKRVRKQEGAIILESANPTYPPRVFTGEDMNKVRVIGKVVEIRRSL
jgi:repressor LexA